MARERSLKEEADMSDIEAVEREYRVLSARVTYAELSGQAVDPADQKRLEELAELRMELIEPDFRSYAAA